MVAIDFSTSPEKGTPPALLPRPGESMGDARDRAAREKSDAAFGVVEAEAQKIEDLAARTGRSKEKMGTLRGLIGVTALAGTVAVLSSPETQDVLDKVHNIAAKLF